MIANSSVVSVKQISGLISFLFFLSFFDERLSVLRNYAVFFSLFCFFLSEFRSRLVCVCLDRKALCYFVFMNFIFLLSIFFNGQDFHMFNDYRRDFLKTFFVLPCFFVFFDTCDFSSALVFLRRFSILYLFFLFALLVYFLYKKIPFVLLRQYGHLSIFFFPLWLSEFFGKRIRLYSIIPVIFLWFFYVITGFRGLMLVSLILTFGFCLKNNSYKLLLGMFFGGLLAVLIVKLCTPGYFAYLQYKLTQVNSGLRVGGAWLPTIQMWLEKPLIGFGYGSHEFRLEFVRYYQLHKEWSNPYVPFPHNVFLEVLFYGGVFALFFFAVFWVRVFLVCVGDPNRFLIFICCFAYFIMHGFLEPVLWQLLPLVLVLVLAARGGKRCG